MTLFTLFLLLFIILSCYIFFIAPALFHKPDYTSLLGVHYAHRGLFDNQTNAPENSLPAFKKAVLEGYGIELDVQLSKDGIPVVFHDADLKRMCHVSGHVWDYTLKELKQFHLANSAEKIPTFEEALRTINGKVPIIVEYKLDIPKTSVCEKGNELLSSYHGTYCIESFHPKALIWYKKNRPDVIRGQLCKEFWKDKQFRNKFSYIFLSYLVTNVLTRPHFIAYKHSDANNLSRKICRLFGALSIAWTIRSQEDYELAKSHFDLFIFDSFSLK